MTDLDILTTAEAAELAQAEAVIKNGMTAFMAVGTALLRIQQKRLYRASYATFDDYLRERWSISRSRGYQMIQAADTIGQLSTIVDTAEVTNEAQARELVTITRMDGIDAAAAVLAEVVDAGPVTAKAIREAHQQDGDDHVVVDDDEQPAAPASAPVPQPQRKPRRRPITDQLRDAADDYVKAARRLSKLTVDDRFGDDHHGVVANAIVYGERDLSLARQRVAGAMWVDKSGDDDRLYPLARVDAQLVQQGPQRRRDVVHDLAAVLSPARIEGARVSLKLPESEFLTVASGIAEQLVSEALQLGLWKELSGDLIAHMSHPSNTPDLNPEDGGA
jgi:hypothetical protein